MAISDFSRSPLALPRLGLGLSSNLDVRASPHPYRLLESDPGLFDFLEYSAPLALEEARAQATLFAQMWERRTQTRALFHPVRLNLYGPELEPVERLQALGQHAQAVGSPWVGNDVGWWHHRGRPFPGYLYIPPPMSAEGVADCVAHAKHVQDHLPVPLLLENPAVFRREGTLHVLDFMAELHARTGCGLILDLGHLLSFQLTHGLPLRTGFDDFPWHAVAEIHLAGGVVTQRGERRFYVDDHAQPLRREVLGLLEDAAPRCSNLAALTYEGDGHPDSVAAATLLQLRPFAPLAGVAHLPAPTAVPELPGVLPGARVGMKTRPWELFDLVHGRPGKAADEEGVRAELDFRRALVAEEVDRSWPLSRMLLAPAAAELKQFVSSEEFKAAFTEEGGGVELSFARYGRARVLSSGDAAASGVMALETWAQSLAARREHRSYAVNGWRLSPEVRVSVFPANLEELLFGAQALKRHLSQRAWACGEVESSGLEGLRQLAGRAPPGPWPVAVRRSRGRLELRGVSALLWARMGESAAGGSHPGLPPAVLGELQEASQGGWWMPPPARAP